MNTSSASPIDSIIDGELDPEDQVRAQEIAAEMAAARERIAQVPASVVVANHAMGLYELAAIHMSCTPPNLSEAKLAIDAIGAIVDTCKGRLGENEQTLNEARMQIQMAYVSLGSGTKADDGASEPAETGPSSTDNEVTD